MKIYLTDEDINQCCLIIVEKVKNNYPQYYTHIQLMYRYGMRISETLYTNEFERTEDGNIIYKMQKTGYYRTIISDSFLAQFDLDNFLLQNSFSHFNKKSLERCIENCCPYCNLRNGDKGINSHIFRHNFAKKIFNKKGNEETVQKRMGEVELKSVRAYLSSKIYYTL